MGTYIETLVEVKGADDQWHVNYDAYSEPTNDTDLFSRQDYNIFGFLANICNRASSPSIAPQRGLPTDSLYFNETTNGFYGPETVAQELYDRMNFGFSWVTLKELLACDYDLGFFDERNQVSTTLRDFLGEYFFAELARLQAVGEPDRVRLIFWFS